MNPEIDQYLKQLTQWQSESQRLKTILLSFPLEEQLKWGQPCYSLAGKTQAGRQMRFGSLKEVIAKERTIKAYVNEAIRVENAGLKVSLKAHSEYKIPEELQKRLDSSAVLKSSFEALTPGRQRGYILHISSPKQPATREERVEKCIDRILDGKSLND